MRDFGRQSNGPRRQGGFRQSFGPREMHKAVCSECGQECEVPFKPAEGRPVFCKDCFMKKKGETGGERRPPRSQDQQSESSGEASEETSEDSFKEETSEDSEEF